MLRERLSCIIDWSWLSEQVLNDSFRASGESCWLLFDYVIRKSANDRTYVFVLSVDLLENKQNSLQNIGGYMIR